MSITAPASDITPDDGFRELVTKIALDTQFQGSFYKEKCLRRRLAVRMRARGLDSFREYGRLLDHDPGEYDLLLDALTINVSKFFRNLEIWTTLEQVVLPALFDGPEARPRIWSAGCASGEEPYSVSVLLHEWAERNGRQAEVERFRIVGTDIDRRSLEAARRAEYPELALTETPADVVGRWFSPGPPFRLDERATAGVSFESRDLISQGAIPGQSLILCRNVIIYFDREIQEELFLRFYEALVPGGFLVLGKVETLLGRTRSLFRPISHRDRIFRKPH